MRQLSELDASFLYLESETTPMHIGGIYLFDASEREKPWPMPTPSWIRKSRCASAALTG